MDKILIRVRRDFDKLSLFDKLVEAKVRLETEKLVTLKEGEEVCLWALYTGKDAYTGEPCKEAFPILEVSIVNHN